MPLQLLEIGFHVEIHAMEWHDFQHETQFHGVVVAWIEFSQKKVGDSSRIQTLLSSLIDFRKGWKTVPPAIFQQLNYQQNLHPSQTRSWLHLRACLDGLQTLPCLRLRRRASVAIRTSARVPDFWRATSQNVDAEWMQHATSPVIKQTATWTTAACQTCGRHPNTP